MGGSLLLSGWITDCVGGSLWLSGWIIGLSGWITVVEWVDHCG